MSIDNKCHDGCKLTQWKNASENPHGHLATIIIIIITILMVTWPQGSSGQELDVVPQLESPSQARICLSSCCRTWDLYCKKKSLLKYWDSPPENFLFKQSFWKIEVGHLRTGEGRETPLQSARCVERVPWGKVKLTMSRSFLFFGQDLFFF